MFSVETSYLFFVILSLIVAAIAAWKTGRQWALGVGVAVSMSAASWFEIDIAGFPVDVLSTVSIVLLVVASAMYWRRLLWPITVMDVLVTALAVWHGVVDLQYGDPVATTAARAYAEWWLAYAAGRYAFMHRSSLSVLAPWFAGVAVVLSVAAMIECWTGINLWEAIFHVADDRVNRPQGLRFDLFHRAIATTRHPIFLGVILMLLSPWAWVTWDSALTRRRAWWGVIAFVLILLGIAATVSRGPVLGMAVAAVFFACVQWRIARIILVPVIVIAIALLVWRFDDVVTKLDESVGVESATIVEVDEDAEIYTGTRNRIFVMKIYGPIVLKGGLLGFGTDNTDQFPPNVPGLPADKRSRLRLRIVDNSFVLVGLRFGIVGLTIFTSLFVAAVVGCLRLRRAASTYLIPCGPVSVTVLAAMFVGVALELLTVYCDYDFVPVLLMHFGVVSGVQLSIREAIRNPA
ncbi:O-antigen ligase family protein [Crateriforma conspicua]|uniref:O-antigen ligase family protein n=1 Tax=Crateriforma conspicua TaxID=2527996 RepID=UPI001187C88F|nr:O-antigen ligase family protein [Crateriforma conspicua]QDV63184.1 O-Antigen ligase [Crateriforma conspicua]